MCSHTAVRVLVVGAGIAGLGSTLAFARRGHSVTLLERDRTGPPSDPGAAFDDWLRPGVGHFRQPHLFLALGRKMLRDEFPTVLATLRAAGARDIDFRTRVPGGAGPEDEDLVGLACRRPLVEAVMRAAVATVPRVDVRTGARVEAIVVDGGTPPRVTGVRTQRGDVLAADLIVDASGRSTHSAQWLADAGAPPIPEESEDCGLIYNCRYFRFRDGHTLPTTQSLFGPVGTSAIWGSRRSLVSQAPGRSRSAPEPRMRICGPCGMSPRSWQRRGRSYRSLRS